MMHRRVVNAAFVPIVTAFIFTGCQGITAQVCTLQGCVPSITFELDVDLQQGETYDVESCVDGACRTGTLGSDTLSADRLRLDLAADQIAVFLGQEEDWSGDHDVSLRVLDGQGELLTSVTETVTMEVFYPNGPDCPPPCGSAVIDA